MTNDENIAEAIRYLEHAIEQETSWQGWYAHGLLDTLKACGGTPEQIADVELIIAMYGIVRQHWQATAPRSYDDDHPIPAMTYSERFEALEPR